MISCRYENVGWGYRPCNVEISFDSSIDYTSARKTLVPHTILPQNLQYKYELYFMMLRIKSLKSVCVSGSDAVGGGAHTQTTTLRYTIDMSTLRTLGVI